MRGRAVAAGLVTAACLSACSGDPEAERKDVEAVEERALAAVDGVVHEVAELNRLEFLSGTHEFGTCGESYAPGGVIHRVSLHLGQADESAEAMVDVAAGALEADGWTVERADNTAIIEGIKDENTVRFHFGPAGTEVEITSSCVETSDDLADEYQDQGSADLTWK
ncbi:MULTISPECIES: hypothetical protein [unclassified Nocardioides]|uniref:hypothetical protein n=1 Tax=unclassified Nocardioides TaxID=2615069 RepID=UPI0006FEA459|nr:MULTISPECIES: hypothetical protein [unclassified Nocardioides]KRA31416.1 hypothetical protein ASD81_18445 [Nocardioides sp. Root614]KRA88036.1 hypothetical protein ASD84_18720 [Nocardioides sp. Root682]